MASVFYFFFFSCASLLGSILAQSQESHIEEFLMILRGQSPTRYNCSGKTAEEWYQTGEKSAILAVYYILTGIFFQALAFPVLYIISQADLLSNSCYRIMFFIGIIELTEITGNSIFPGFTAAVGAVHCTHPISTTIVGKVTMVQWLSGTCACILLALNRLVDLKNCEFANKIFDRPYKVHILLSLCLIYGIIGSLFFDTLVFNSLYMAPLLDPMIGDQGFTYSNYFLTVHNPSICLILTVLYISLSVVWYIKKNSNSQTSSLQKQVFLQSIMISMTYSIPAVFFVSMYYIPNCPKWFFLVSDISYQLSGGIPFILHIVMNRTVRIRVFKLLKLQNHVAPIILRSNNHLSPHGGAGFGGYSATYQTNNSIFLVSNNNNASSTRDTYNTI